MCRGEARAGGGGARRTQSLFPSSSLGGRTSVHWLWHFKSARKEKRLKEISSSSVGGKEVLGEKFPQAHYAIVKIGLKYLHAKILLPFQFFLTRNELPGHKGQMIIPTAVGTGNPTPSGLSVHHFVSFST